MRTGGRGSGRGDARRGGLPGTRGDPRTPRPWPGSHGRAGTGSRPSRSCTVVADVMIGGRRGAPSGDRPRGRGRRLAAVLRLLLRIHPGIGRRSVEHRSPRRVGSCPRTPWQGPSRRPPREARGRHTCCVTHRTRRARCTLGPGWRCSPRWRSVSASRWWPTRFMPRWCMPVGRPSCRTSRWLAVSAEIAVFSPSRDGIWPGSSPRSWFWNCHRQHPRRLPRGAHPRGVPCRGAGAHRGPRRRPGVARPGDGRGCRKPHPAR